MKKILFPTDFSDAADQAFVYALQLASKLDAELLVLHIWHPSGVAEEYMTASLEGIYRDLDLANFENFRDEIPHLREMAANNGLEQVSMTFLLDSGLADECIIQAADDNEVDLIIMGTRGASGLRRIFLGTTTAEVMENAHCPVLGVPEKGTFDPSISTIVFSVNFEPAEQEALQKVLAFAEAFDADIYCLHVDVSHTHELTRRMDSWKAPFADHPRLHFQVIDGNDTRKEILSFVEQNEVDLLAMLIHKRGFFEELFNLSYTKQLAYHAHLPILALQAQEG
jgi:nucleotide-binding universal stress UspA family protein